MAFLPPLSAQGLPRLSVTFNASETMAGVQMYEIIVCDGTRQWTVNRRYKDFCRLHDELRGHCELAWSLAPLPPKSFLRRRLSETFMHRRYAALEAWLKALLVLDATCAASPELLAFLLPPRAEDGAAAELKPKMVSVPSNASTCLASVGGSWISE